VVYRPVDSVLKAVGKLPEWLYASRHRIVMYWTLSEAMTVIEIDAIPGTRIFIHPWCLFHGWAPHWYPIQTASELTQLSVLPLNINISDVSIALESKSMRRIYDTVTPISTK